MKIDITLGICSKEKIVGFSQSAQLDLEELLATRLLVQGNSGSGKSHLLRRLLEQSAEWVQQCVIDPEGDFVTLSERFGHLVVEATHVEQDLARIAARIREHRVSSVLNLEGLDSEQQMRAAAAFLGGLFDAPRDFWYPLLVVVDEAQLFAPAAGGEVGEEARKLSLTSMTNLMCRGRKRGLAGVIATQRLAKLAKNVAAEASNFLMGRTFLDIDMARAADLLGMERRQAEMFRDLERGHFIALGPALARRPLAIKIGEVETSPRSSSPKLIPLPQPQSGVDELIFTKEKPALRQPVARPSVPSPAQSTARMLQEVANHNQQLLELKIPDPVDILANNGMMEENETKLDTIISDIISDCDAAFRSTALLYQDFLTRCRISRVTGKLPDLSAFRRRLSLAQADIDEEMAKSHIWHQALILSNRVSDDLQGVFLHLVSTAIRTQPCPSDATLARLYGTHSHARARRLLSYFEEQGLLVLRHDFSGKRSVAFPELGLETAANHPDTPDIQVGEQKISTPAQ